MIIRLPGCYPLILRASLAHWKREGTHHGPKSDPVLIAAKLVRLESNPYGRWGVDVIEKFPSLLSLSKSEGRRLWVYFRGGYAWHCEYYINRSEAAMEQEIMKGTAA